MSSGVWVRRGAAVAFVAAAVVAFAVTYGSRAAEVIYLVPQIVAAVMSWIGALRAPQGRRLIARMIALGVTLTVVADVAWSLLDWSGAKTDLSIADPLWFFSYVAIGIALYLVLHRSRGSRVEADFALDVATIVLVSLLAFWSLSVQGIVVDPSLSTSERLVLASYPIADAVILALVLRVLLSTRARTLIGPAFAAGIGLWLMADVASLRSPSDPTALLLMDVAWMVAPSLLASATWRTVPVRTGSDHVHPGQGWAWQVAIATLPLLVPPLLEAIAHLRDISNPGQALVGTAALLALTIVRIRRLLGREAAAFRDLEQARDESLEAARVKYQFVANMSHEFRTPLTTMLASSELLEETTLDPQQQRLLSKVRSSGVHLLGLVDSVLDFSRVEAGELRVSPEEMDVLELVAGLRDEFGPRATGRGLAFDTRVHPEVPRLVRGDVVRIRQVLGNLLDNAVKFTPDGAVRLSLRASADGRLDFVVSDTGIGIPPENQADIFSAFSQVDGSATRRYGGSGLGLAICWELIQLMGGTITVKSRAWEGSAFTVSLPLLPSRAPAGSTPAADAVVAPEIG